MAKQMPDKWEIVDHKVGQIKKLAKEAQVDLDNFFRKFEKLNKLTKEAYLEAPIKDRNFNSSPIGPERFIFFVKKHLLQRGLRLSRDFVSYPGKKELTFSDEINASTKFLTKHKENTQGVANG